MNRYGLEEVFPAFIAAWRKKHGKRSITWGRDELRDFMSRRGYVHADMSRERIDDAVDDATPEAA